MVHVGHFTMAICYIVFWIHSSTKLRGNTQIIYPQHAFWQVKESPETGGHPQNIRWDDFDYLCNEDDCVLNVGAQEVQFTNSNA